MLAIHDLRECPRHTEEVAERIWKAFWQRHGTPFATIRDGLQEILQAEGGVPFAMVAEIDGKPCGNVLMIDNDEPTRPDLGPWVAAVWVDEDRRGHGIARAMIDHAVRRCAALGVPRVYLVSRPALRGFYNGIGWRELENDVGRHRLVLYAWEPGAVPSPP